MTQASAFSGSTSAVSLVNPRIEALPVVPIVLGEIGTARFWTTIGFAPQFIDRGMANW